MTVGEDEWLVHFCDRLSASNKIDDLPLTLEIFLYTSFVDHIQHGGTGRKIEGNIIQDCPTGTAKNTDS